MISLVFAALLFFAGSRWLTRDRRSLGLPRNIAFVTGFAGACVAIAIFAVFEIRAYRMGGYGTNFGAAYDLMRPSSWLAIASFLLCWTGRGWSRRIAVLACVLLFGIWAVLAMAM